MPILYEKLECDERGKNQMPLFEWIKIKFIIMKKNKITIELSLNKVEISKFERQERSASLTERLAACVQNTETWNACHKTGKTATGGTIQGGATP